MRNVLCTGALALTLLAPVAASAQSASASPSLPGMTASEQLIVLRPAQLMAIGAGLIAGAVVVQAAIPTRLGLLAGAALGGYLGNLWYGGRQLELHVSTPPRT